MDKVELRNDGTINPTKFADWQENYAGALRAIGEAPPGFADRFSSAAKATEAMIEAGAARTKALDAYRKGVAGNLLGATTPSEVENRRGTMLTDSKTGPSRMRALMAKVQHDPDAVDGMRKAAVDWMTRKFAATAEAGTSGEKKISGAKFQTFVRDHRWTLEELFPKEQVNMFGGIAADIERSNRVDATAVRGSPGTAKDLAPFLKKAVEQVKHHSFLGAVGGGAFLGFEHSKDWMHAAYGAGAGGIAHLVSKYRSHGMSEVQAVFRDALLNPDRARWYISKVQDTGQTGPAAILSRALRRALVIGPPLQQSTTR